MKPYHVYNLTTGQRVRALARNVKEAVVDATDASSHEIVKTERTHEGQPVYNVVGQPWAAIPL